MKPPIFPARQTEPEIPVQILMPKGSPACQPNRAIVLGMFSSGWRYGGGGVVGVMEMALETVFRKLCEEFR